MESKNPKNKQLTMVFTVAMTGLGLYWTFSYTGPYRYLAELQLKWFGSYSPKLTLMVVVLGLLGLGALLKLAFRGAERPVPGPLTPSQAPPTNQVRSVVPSAPAGMSWQQKVRFLAPLFMVGFGAWAYLNGTQAGSLQDLKAGDFQNGNVHARIVYANVNGQLGETYISQNHYLYIPMFAEAQGAAPVQLLVGVDENQERNYLRREADGSFTVRGVADKMLAGDVKYTFEKNGVHVADSAWVVHAGREPGGDRKFGLIMIAIGFGVALLILALNARRNRKSTQARPLRALA